LLDLADLPAGLILPRVRQILTLDQKGAQHETADDPCGTTPHSLGWRGAAMWP
jgi:hypothetical protein